MKAKDAPVMPDNRGFVTCAKHDTRRKVSYCTIRPVYDADLEVVSYQYECKEGQTCTSRRVGHQKPCENVSNLSGFSETSPDGPSITSSTIKIIDCSTSHMFGNHISSEDQSKNITRSRPLPMGTENETGSFSVLFTKKVEHLSTDEYVDEPSIKSANSDSKKLSDAKDTKKSDSHTALSEEVGNLQNRDISCSSPGLTSQTKLSTNDQLLQSQGVADAKGVVRPTLLSPRAAISSRYFDLKATNSGGGSTFPTKVCWNCGLLDHEKPECPNLLCRTCHGRRGMMSQQHFCEEIHVASPFVVLPRSPGALPQSTNGMPSVQCVYCEKLGHFDCSDGRVRTDDIIGRNTIIDIHPVDLILSCCFCGAKGHTGYECHKRQRVHPDRWVQRNVMFAARCEAEFNRSGGGAMPSHQRPFSQHSVSIPRNQQFSRDTYQRNSSNGERYSNADGSSSDVYGSSYKRWCYREETKKYHDTNYGNHEPARNGLECRWKVDNSYDLNPDHDHRSDRHSRRNFSEKDRRAGMHGRFTHRNSHYLDTNTRSAYSDREAHGSEQFKAVSSNQRITKGQGRGGRRAYSGFSSDEDLF